MALTELCYAINYSSSVNVWEHTFAPREYLTQHLESRFNKYVNFKLVLRIIEWHSFLVFIIFILHYFRSLVKMCMFNAENNEIAKPSELLTSVRSFMSVLQSIENYGEIFFFMFFALL